MIHGEENSSDGSCRIRPVLGDVTNQFGKRGFSTITGNLGLKSGDKYCGNVEKKDEGSQFVKKLSLGVESLVKGNCIINCVDYDKERGKQGSVMPGPCSEIKTLSGNAISGISKIHSEIREPSLSDVSLKLGRGITVNQSTKEVGGVVRDSCVSGISMPKSSCDGSIPDADGKCGTDEGRLSIDTTQSDSLHEQLTTQVCGSAGNDLGVDNLASSQSGSIGCSRLPESQESKNFGLERCTGLKGDACSNLSPADLIKTCACSFCTKAAYIWSDLHYQDIKGRIAALKKSQKEASIMVQRSCRKQ
ncbi:unnamed protein product, partial [Ilex paraguariensis]